MRLDFSVQNSSRKAAWYDSRADQSSITKATVCFLIRCLEIMESSEQALSSRLWPSCTSSDFNSRNTDQTESKVVRNGIYQVSPFGRLICDNKEILAALSFDRKGVA